MVELEISEAGALGPEDDVVLAPAAPPEVAVLSDQPALSVDNINALIAAFAKREDKSVVVPMYQGRRGNPIVISTGARDRIVVEKTNFGCRRFIEKHPESVMLWAVSEPAFVLDLDTPEDYQVYCKSTVSAQLSSQTGDRV